MIAQLPESEAIRSVFETVLASPDFEPARTSLAARVVRFIWQAIDRLFGDWLPALEEGPLEVISLLLVVSAAVAVVAVAWKRTLGRRGPSTRRGPAAPAVGPRGVGEWAEWGIPVVGNWLLLVILFF